MEKEPNGDIKQILAKDGIPPRRTQTAEGGDDAVIEGNHAATGGDTQIDDSSESNKSAISHEIVHELETSKSLMS